MTTCNAAIQTNLPWNPFRYEGAVTLAEAQLYCKRLVQSRPENYLVATLFCPREFRQDCWNFYAFGRIADDLSDETGGREYALPLLDWWEEELDALYRGSPVHPVFVSLADSVERLSLPKTLFQDLINAYRQDHVVTRYPTFEDLQSYCAGSIIPYGRLVLIMFGYRDTERFALSDLCWTAQQLTDNWSDVAEDYAKDRLYIPLEDMERFGVTEADIAEKRFTPEFAALMQFEVDRTRALFEQGEALYARLDRHACMEFKLYNRCAQAVLDEIERRGFNVLTHRVSLPKSRLIGIMMRCRLGH